jgi:ketosteroid isomerase-like protein
MLLEAMGALGPAVIAAAVLVAIGCGIDEGRQGRNGAAAAELLAADEAFAAASRAEGPAEAFRRFLLPDALALPNGRDVVRGRAAVVAGLAATPELELLWEPQHAEVSASGDLGWTWGRYAARAGAQPPSHGKYLNVWRRDDQGRWRVAVDMGNASPAPE